MQRPDPTLKTPPDIPALVATLARHEVTWLLAGSCVLAPYASEIVPNDLDAVVRRDAENLQRLARCLDDLHAVPFWCGDPEWDLGTPEEHRAWRPHPATTGHLDRLYVTRHGMLDIPFALIPDYADLIATCTRREIAGHAVDVCDPRSVLTALAHRRRRKDIERQEIYAGLRRRFGLPPLPPDR